MKILMLNYEYPPIGGGGGVISKNIAEGLAQLGHQVEVLTTWFKNTSEISTPHQNLKLIRLKAKRAHDFKSNPVEMLDWVVKTKKFCATYLVENKFDLCFANFVLPGGEVAVYLKQKFNLPFVVISHGHDIPWVHGKRLWPLYLLGYTKIKAVLKYADKVFLQTPQMLDNLKQFDKKFVNKVAIVPNGFSNNCIVQKEKSKTFQVIFVGRVVKQKDPATLIHGFINFIESGGAGELKILGDGPMKSQIEKILRHLGFDKNVVLFGKKSQQEVMNFLTKSSVFVCTSLNEGMSIAMLEAAASGIPIISTPVSGTSQLLNTDNSLIIDFKNPKQLTEALHKVYKAWQIEAEFPSNNSIQQIRENFNWQKISKLYENHLMEVVK